LPLTLDQHPNEGWPQQMTVARSYLKV